MKFKAHSFATHFKYAAKRVLVESKKTAVRITSNCGLVSQTLRLFKAVRNCCEKDGDQVVQARTYGDRGPRYGLILWPNMIAKGFVSMSTLDRQFDKQSFAAHVPRQSLFTTIVSSCISKKRVTSLSDVQHQVFSADSIVLAISAE